MQDFGPQKLEHHKGDPLLHYLATNEIHLFLDK